MTLIGRGGAGRRRWIVPLVIVAVLTGVGFGVVRTLTTPRGPGPGPVAVASTPPGTRAPVPAFAHAWIIVLENKAVDRVIDNPDAPYLAELVKRFGLATAYQGVAHPSQPNYLAMVSGSTQGVKDDSDHDLAARTIFDQLESAGKTWRVYAENVPAGCFRGTTAKDGPDGKGTYTRKHNPAISFTGISGTPARCANIQALSAFEPGAADLELIVPNMCHDMHDCSVKVGDAWLRSFVPRILDSPAFQAGGALFIIFDEGAGSGVNANQVATIVAGPSVPAGSRSDVPHTHYSLLRTLQDAWKLDCLEASCSANTLGEFFR